jgi:hypothetical protein
MKYKIYGRRRKALKSEVSLLKRYIDTYWECWSLNNDMYMFYGHSNPVSENVANTMYNDSVAELEAKKWILSIPFGV